MPARTVVAVVVVVDASKVWGVRDLPVAADCSFLLADQQPVTRKYLVCWG